MKPRAKKPKLKRCPVCKSFAVFIEKDGGVTCLTCSDPGEKLSDRTGDVWAENSQEN